VPAGLRAVTIQTHLSMILLKQTNSNVTPACQAGSVYCTMMWFCILCSLTCQLHDVSCPRQVAGWPNPLDLALSNACLVLLCCMCFGSGVVCKVLAVHTNYQLPNGLIKVRRRWGQRHRHKEPTAGSNGKLKLMLNSKQLPPAHPYPMLANVYQASPFRPAMC
jgi:hypothetical protein